jgi:hypothetical protein
MHELAANKSNTKDHTGSVTFVRNRFGFTGNERDTTQSLGGRRLLLMSKSGNPSPAYTSKTTEVLKLRRLNDYLTIYLLLGMISMRRIVSTSRLLSILTRPKQSPLQKPV